MPKAKVSIQRAFGYESEIFGQMLVDIFSCAPPNLNIMDAIHAMEGEGPSSDWTRCRFTPREMQHKEDLEQHKWKKLKS